MIDYPNLPWTKKAIEKAFGMSLEEAVKKGFIKLKNENKNN